MIMSLDLGSSNKPTAPIATTAMPNPLSAAAMQNHHPLLSLLTRLPLRQAPSAQSTKRDEGLSLIECLVAIVVVSITLIAITPPIFFITATRVQSRKAEQALQVAQAEIDRVRAVVERGVYTAADLPAVVANISTVPAPTSVVAGVMKSSIGSCNTYTGATVAVTALLPVNTDLDPSNLTACQSQFLVQTFRTAGTAGSSVPTSGFRLGVRVYSDNPLLRQNLSGLQTAQASLRFVSGLGDQNRRPLAILYSTIVRNDTSNSLQDYRTVCSTPNGC
jgi:prepilin-type N-terminal cleavage/methylation domain-containing protein